MIPRSRLPQSREEQLAQYSFEMRILMITSKDPTSAIRDYIHNSRKSPDYDYIKNVGKRMLVWRNLLERKPTKSLDL